MKNFAENHYEYTQTIIAYFLVVLGHTLHDVCSVHHDSFESFQIQKKLITHNHDISFTELMKAMSCFLNKITNTLHLTTFMFFFCIQVKYVTTNCITMLAYHIISLIL